MVGFLFFLWRAFHNNAAGHPGDNRTVAACLVAGGYPPGQCGAMSVMYSRGEITVPFFNKRVTGVCCDFFFTVSFRIETRAFASVPGQTCLLFIAFTRADVRSLAGVGTQVPFLAIETSETFCAILRRADNGTFSSVDT